MGVIEVVVAIAADAFECSFGWASAIFESKRAHAFTVTSLCSIGAQRLQLITLFPDRIDRIVYDVKLTHDYTVLAALELFFVDDNGTCCAYVEMSLNRHDS